MNIDDFLARLSGVRPEGDGHWMARCPAHDDRNPSLSVGAKPAGKILLKCFAGCSAQSVAAALGLQMRDLMGEKSEEPQKKRAAGKGGGKRGRIVETYDYKDAAGATVFQVCRMEPKSFCQRVPDPAGGGWAWGRSRYGVQEVLYRLPQVKAAIEAGRVIFIVEGEKDVAALEGIGCVATCNPGGAGKWRGKFAEDLNGARRVVVIADNDAGPECGKKEFWQGQRHASDVVESLRAAGVPVTGMVLPAIGGKAVKDAADWVAAGGTQDALREAVKAAGEWDCQAWRDGQESGASAPLLPPNTGKSHPVDVIEWRGKQLQVESGVGLRKAIAVNVYEAGKDESGNYESLNAFERREVVALVVVAWLKIRGRFYFHKRMRCWTTCMYFDDERDVLMMIESDLFWSWLSIEAGINRSTPDWKFVAAAVCDTAMDAQGGSVGIEPSEYWERRGETIYLSCGDSRMARITAGGVDIVPNGTDNVLFALGSSLADWKLMPGSGKDPFEATRLFSSLACVSKHGRMLVKLWLLGLPACHKCKPPLVFTGSIGSGKTRAAVGVAEILGVDKRIATIAENGDKDFWVSVSSGGVLCFDNVDSRIKWFSDAMQSAATDGTQETRQMYTHNRLVLSAKANVIITSSNPMFAADSGLADRLIVVRLDRRIADTAESALTSDIEHNRSECLTWMARTLARALADTSELGETLNRRHPDFAAFAVKCARAMGCEDDARAALADAEADKSRFAVENDFVGSLIMSAVDKAGGFTGTTTDLIQLIEGSEEIDERTKQRLSPSRVGKRIEILWEHFEVLLGAKKSLNTGKKHYRFTPIVGGLVDVEGKIEKLSHERETREIFLNAGLKSTSPLIEEEANGEMEIEL